MIRIKRSVAYAAILLVLALLSTSAALAKEPLKTRLANGLVVIIDENKSAPVVAVQMWVRSGSADEGPKQGGISHVFEHMLFKGTAKRAVGELAGAVESVGGSINAYTSFDNTVYHLTVPSRHFSTGLDVISDAIQRSAFDPAELKKEIEVVLEEIRMNEDSPGRMLYRSLLSNAYAWHPYKRPVIGTVESVSAFTRKDILDYFKRRYRPNNMTLVIVGDVDADEALKTIKGLYSGFEKATMPERNRPQEPPQKETRVTIKGAKLVETHMGLGFHIPDIKHEDTYAIDVLANILAGGETSRLYKKLKIEDKLVHGISAYAMTPKDPGLFIVTSTLKTENVEKTVKGVFRELRRLEAEGPDDDEITKARLSLESDFVYSNETMDDIASKLGHYETLSGDLKYEDKYLNGIRRVGSGDIKRVLKTYFAPTQATIAIVAPETEKDALTQKLIATAATEQYTGSIEKPSDNAQKQAEVIVLDNGIRLLVKEDNTNPTVAIYAAFPGGLRFESPANNGIGAFTASMLTRGTKDYTRLELADELEKIAGSVSGYSGWNSTGASAKFLSRFFDKGLGLFADVLINPVFPEDEVEKLREDTLAAIKRQEDYLPGYTFKLLYKELFKTHPYGMPVSGIAESIAGIRREDLAKHHETYFAPERMVLTIVGDVDKDQVVESVKRLFKDFPRKGAQLTMPAQEEAPSSIRSTGAIKEKAQTNIGIGFLGVKVGSKESYAMQVLTEVLSGQGGRLFMNLRDKRSLAYSVSAISKEGVDRGLFAIYIGSAPEKKDEAIDAILDELEALRQSPVTEAELSRAKNSIVGGYEIGLQAISSVASDMAINELLGLGHDYYKRYPEKILSITAEDVMKAANEFIKTDAYTISVVGPNGAGKKEGAKEK